MAMDDAWKKTDKILKDTEHRVADVYSDNPLLVSVMNEFNEYMDMVSKVTKSLYNEYQNAVGYEDKVAKKKAYTDELKRLTVQSPRYRKIAKKYAKAMSRVNQEALDIVNGKLSEIYAINYNHVAEKCKEYGIKVDGTTEV